MSSLELIVEIEKLRRVMSTLASYGCSTGDLLEVSRQLDQLIVQYQKAAG
jgi:hypothetical protein